MAIFKVTHKSGDAAIVRACCVKCAREVASKADGDRWARRNDVAVEVVTERGRDELVAIERAAHVG